MNNRERLLQDGYLVFSGVVPPDLCRRSEDIINATEPGPCFIWKDEISMEFRRWGHAFLDAQDLQLHGWECDLHIFNRRPGTDSQYWHDDNYRNHPYYQQGQDLPGRRVFACTYFVSTFNGRAPLRVIPNSHHGGYAEFRERFTKMRLEVSDIDPHPPFNRPFAGYPDGKKAPELYPDIFGDHPDQISLEVPAGTMILCDERILHGTPINSHTERRPMALWWLQKNPADRQFEAEYAARFFASQGEPSQ